MYPTQVAVDEPAKQVTLSKILLWYGADFAPAGDTQALLRVLRGYLPAASEVGVALDAIYLYLYLSIYLSIYIYIDR